MPNLRFAAPKERRVAIITGGARHWSRLRLTHCRRRPRHCDCRSADDHGPDVVKEIEALGQKALFIKTDVTDEAAVQAMVAQTVEQFGRRTFWSVARGILGREATFLEQSVTSLKK